MSTAQRPLRADARRNQERLIASAREVFNERGVDAKMDEIARRAGVGPGTLYRHFATREEVLARIYRSDIEAIAGRAAELSQSLPPMDALNAWLAEQLDFIAHKIGIGAAIKSMLRDDVETMDYCRDTMRGALRRLLEPLQEAGLIRADIDPATVLRLLHGVGIASEAVPEQAPLMLNIMIAGLRA